MGSWIDFSNVINIGNKSISAGAINILSYKDINDKIRKSIIENNKIKYIQIEKQLPIEAFDIIDKLLEIRPDITFGIFDLMGDNYFDLDILCRMKHLTKLRLDGHLVDNPRVVETQKICKIENLKELSINLFDLKDYSFIKELNPSLESILIMADTMKGTPVFDCKWLLSFTKLHTVWIGKKAKKNFEYLSELPKLNKLSIRGIKLNDFYFLKNTSIKALSILWSSVIDFNSINVLENLKYLELWRIPKLNDISAINKLNNLETLKLQDLSHLNIMPDISNLKHLKEIILINTPIDKTSIPPRITVSNW